MADRAADRLAAVRRALAPAGIHSLPAVVIAGGCVLDVVATPSMPVITGGSVPGAASAAAGGVGLNFARALAALQAPARPPVRLVSVVGDDAAGRTLLAAAAAAGVDCGGVCVDPTARTPLVVTLLDPATRDAAASIADVGAVEAGVEAEAVLRAVREAADAARASFSTGPLVLDANLRADVVAAVSAAHTITLLEPVSAAKAARLVAAGAVRACLATPNAAELVAMARECGWRGDELDVASLSSSSLSSAVARLAPAARALLAARVAAAVLVTVGPLGAALIAPSSVVRATPLLPALVAAATATAPPTLGPLAALLSPAAPSVVSNTAGAGDALAAGALAALLAGAGACGAVAGGCAAAAQVVASAGAAPPLDRGEAARVAAALETGATWVELP